MENYQFITHLQQFPERTSKIYIYFSGFPVEKYIEKKVVLIMKSLILWDISVEKFYKKDIIYLGKKGGQGQHGRQCNEADNNKLYRNIPAEMG